jgi:hypothetical protein
MGQLQAEFAAELRRLHRAAGKPSYRALSGRARDGSTGSRSHRHPSGRHPVTSPLSRPDARSRRSARQLAFDRCAWCVRGTG